MPVMLPIGTVDEYIRMQPESAQPGLELLRKTIKDVVPGADEVISYGMPAFKQDGIIVWYAATKKHFGLYPKAEAIAIFSKQLLPYSVSKGTIRFPIDEPLPLPLIRDIVLFRTKENKALADTKKKGAKRQPAKN